MFWFLTCSLHLCNNRLSPGDGDFVYVCTLLLSLSCASEAKNLLAFAVTWALSLKRGPHVKHKHDPDDINNAIVLLNWLHGETRV